MGHCLVAWVSLGHAFTVRLMASHLTLQYFVKKRSSDCKVPAPVAAKHFNMLTEAYRVWHVVLVLFAVSQHCIVWLWNEFAGISTPVKLGNCLKNFLLVNNFSHYKMMHFVCKWQKIWTPYIADIFPPWCCVNPHHKAPEHQSAKTSALIEMVTTAADQLIKGFWLAVPGTQLLVLV